MRRQRHSGTPNIYLTTQGKIIISERKATALFDQALDLEFSEPLRALNLLKQAVRDYPQTLTVNNYVLDSIIRIAISNNLWDEAIEVCNLAQKLKPEYRDSYSLEAEACRLDKEGKRIEATEIRYKKDTFFGEWFGTVRNYGNKFAQLGDNDKAWAFYNKAVILAAKDNQSSHTVREAMAALLLSENESIQAAELILVGIEDAEKYSKKGAPKSLSTFLRKILRQLGIKDSRKAEELVIEYKIHGKDEAMRLLNTFLGEN